MFKKLLILPILVIGLSGCSNGNPNPEQYYEAGYNPMGCVPLKTFCLKSEKEFLKKAILECSKNARLFAPNGGEYEDWDTTDYQYNIHACAKEVFKTVCMCN